MHPMIGPIVVNIYRWLFARAIFKTFNTHLLRLSLVGLGVSNYENSYVSGEHHLVTKILPTYVKSDAPIFFDVGANIGNFSYELLNAFPNATIHAFEPHPETFQELKRAMKTKSVICHNLAFGVEAGTLDLHDRGDYHGSSHASLHREVISDLHKQQVVTRQVFVESIDAFAARSNIAFVDFLKIDTEGHELAVLQGAESMLLRRQIGCIHFEFNEMNVVSRAFFRDFRKLLHSYQLYRLLPGGLLPLGDSPLETELFVYQNIVALPV